MVGQTVANYRIVEELGTGGMGVVYKAQDIRLNRFLALKFLKPERVTEDFKRRFFQEARSASALNHPGIIHIYDIGQWEGADFIAMEFVEGSTLYQVLRARRLPLAEALRIAAQVADALMAAHAAGIVHRDLKPGNVMLTTAGLVKVLDFGLAKLNEPPPAASSSTESASTQTLAYTGSHTEPGLVFGSPPYMSPEQALAQAVDARSDIFAFGLLLYELLTGQPAFKGRTKFEVLSAVLHVDAPAPSRSNREVSKALDAVVARCLRKNPEERYQSMIEVKQALERVGRHPTAPRWIVRSAVAAALVATLAVIFLAVRGRHIFAPAEQAPAETIRLTSDAGLNLLPAISPDGTLLAYASDRGGQGNLDLWIKQVAGGEPLRLTNDPGDDSEPDFSPDATQIVFRATRDGGGLYMVPAMGGHQRKIAEKGRRPKFSPDGSRIAYWSGIASPFPLRAGNAKVFVFDLADSSARELRPDFAAATHPVWSPDGKQILFFGLKDANDLNTAGWWIAPVNGGPPVRCQANGSNGNMLDPFAWRGDRVYWASQTRGLNTIGEIRIDPKTGAVLEPPRRLTTGTSDESSPAVSKSGLVVFSSLTNKRNVIRVPLDPNTARLGGERRALTGDISNTSIESVSANGTRIANISDRTGQAEVWVKDLSDGRESQLTTSGGNKTDARITPDGSAVAWREDNVKHLDTFLTAFDGSSTRRICADCKLQFWTPDGKLGLIERQSAHTSIGILDAVSGQESDYLAAPGLDLIARSLSSDGKYLAFTAHRTNSDFTIYVAPFAPDRPPPQSAWIRVLAAPDADPNPQWSPDGALLYFSSDRDGHNCVWAQKLDRATRQPLGRPFDVAHFHARAATMTAPSPWLPVVLAPDALLVTIQERSGQIWLLRPATGKP